MNIFGGTIYALENALDYSAAKNRAISTNIANVDTPGYKSKDVVFKDVLNEKLDTTIAMRTTHPKHIAQTPSLQRPYEIITNNSTTYHHNGNNVDIDKEMSELAKNQIYYNSLAERMNGKFQNLKNVIRGGN